MRLAVELSWGMHQSYIALSKLLQENGDERRPTYLL